MQHDNLESKLEVIRKEKYDAMKRVRELKLKVMENAMKIQSMNEPLLDQYIQIFEEKIAEAQNEQKELKHKLQTLQNQLSKVQSNQTVSNRNVVQRSSTGNDDAKMQEMQRRIAELERQNRELRERQ